MPNTFKSNLTSGLGTTGSNVYVCQAATQATIIGMSIANKTGADITANVVLFQGATNAFLAHMAPIPTGQTLIPVGGDQKLVLEAGEYLQVQTSLTSSADVIVSTLEIT
jgi:hypothetical protein